MFLSNISWFLKLILFHISNIFSFINTPRWNWGLFHYLVTFSTSIGLLRHIYITSSGRIYLFGYIFSFALDHYAIFGLFCYTVVLLHGTVFGIFDILILIGGWGLFLNLILFLFALGYYAIWVILLRPFYVTGLSWFYFNGLHFYFPLEECGFFIIWFYFHWAGLLSASFYYYYYFMMGFGSILMSFGFLLLISVGALLIFSYISSFRWVISLFGSFYSLILLQGVGFRDFWYFTSH